MATCRELVLIEMLKLRKSRSFLFGILAISAFPFLMAIVIATDSYVGPGNQSVLIWLSTQLFNSNVLYVAPTVFVVICSNFFAKEIDSGSLDLYISRVGNRAVIYKSKVISLIIFAAFVFLGVSILLTVMYYTLVSTNINVASGEFFGEIHIWESVAILTILFMYNSVLIPSISVSLGAFFKPLPATGILISLLVVSQYLHGFSTVVKYFTPWTYVVELTNTLMVDSQGLTGGSSFAIDLMVSTLLTMFFSVVAYITGLKKFVSRDL